MVKKGRERKKRKKGKERNALKSSKANAFQLQKNYVEE